MKSSPCAVEVVLTLAAASGDSGGIEPEGRPAVPIGAALISIITVRQQSISTQHPINISMWKGIYCHRVCSTSLSYLALYNRWPGGLSGTEAHHYYVLIKAAVDECAVVVSSSVYIHPGRGLFPYTRTTNSDLPAENDLHLTEQGKQVSIPITGMTLIYQLITKPEQIN